MESEVFVASSSEAFLFRGHDFLWPLHSLPDTNGMRSWLSQGCHARAMVFDSESVSEVSGPHEGPGVLVLAVSEIEG